MGMGGRSSKLAPAPKTFKKVTAEFNGDIKNPPEGWDQTKLDATRSSLDEISASTGATRLTTFLAGDNETGCGVRLRLCGDEADEARVAYAGHIIGHSGVVSKDRSSAYQWPRSKISQVMAIDDKAACDANPSLGVKLRNLTLHESVYEKGVKKLQRRAA
ncbi:uncharacterized protein ARMOST_14895 [Armillaria ostoyae]|uniref:Uncharacterized protein n=1 Tax=Armillaria ostoyae TaxID=47428 RepID=A0A284RRW5_ARMOS|nr:uncharacterized protein ARMOST_14895 [Armillaria ostoyae]